MLKKTIECEVVLSASYGKVIVNYKPLCAIGKKLLDHCKEKFNYKPVKEGQERGTFESSWNDYVLSLVNIKVVKVPTVKIPSIGQVITVNSDLPDFLR